MKKKKLRIDKIVKEGRSPLESDPYWWEEEGEEEWEAEAELGEEKLSISGEMEVGSGGHPVTIKMIDEVTGMEMEINHVQNAMLMIEDQRRAGNGWLAMVVGDVARVGEVMRFVASATVEEMKKMLGRRRKKKD